MVRAAFENWAQRHRIDPVVFTWPESPIVVEGDPEYEGICAMALPADPKQRGQALRAFVKQTKAFALFLVEQEPDQVRLLFESKVGSRAWTIPIETRVGVKLLGKAEVLDNQKTTRLLWPGPS